MNRARHRSMGCLGAIILLVVGGAFSGVGFFVFLKPEWEARHRFTPGECTVLAERIVEGTSSGKGGRRNTTYRPEFHIRYEAGGRSLEADTFRIVAVSTSSRSDSQKALDRFEVGQRYPCWFDPSDPKRVVLDREYSFLGLLFAGIGVVVALLGGLALLWRLARLLLFAAAVKAG